MSGKIGCKKFFGDFKKQISFAYSVFHLKIAIKRKLTSLDSIHPCFKGIDIKFSKFPSYIDVEPAYQPFLTYLTEMYDEDNKKSFYRGVFLLCSWSFNLEDFLKYIEVIDAYNHVIEQAFFKFAKALSTQKDGYSKVVAYLNQFKEVPQKESLQSPESCHDANAYDNDSKSEEDKTESSPSLKAKINNSENLLVQDASSSRDTSETGLRSIETPSPPTVSHDSNLSPIDPLDQQGDNNASFEEESNSMPNLSVSPIPLDQQGDINASFEKESNSMPKPANESTSNVDFSIEVLRDPSTNELNITPPIDKVVENEFYNQNICKNYDENETSSENNTNARDDHTTSPTVKVPKMNIKPANAKYNSRSDPRLSAVPLTNSPKKPTSQPHKSKLDINFPIHSF